MIQAVSPDKIHPFFVSEAKALGIGPVLVVNVLGDHLPGVVLDELKIADIVIEPEVQKFNPEDFQKKIEAEFRGKKCDHTT